MQKTSGVLVVGRTFQHQEMGADVVSTFDDAKARLHQQKPSVIVFGLGQGSKAARGKAFEDFCEFCLQETPQSLWVLSSEGLPPSQLLYWSNFGRVYDLVEGFDDASLAEKTRSALEKSGEDSQRAQLTEMFSEQSHRLKKLSEELEGRVEKRQKTLRKSLSKLEATKLRLESLHKALLGIHRAATVLQIEQTLNEALKPTLELEWVRVRFANQSLLSKNSLPNVISIDIPFPHDPLRGEVLFATPTGKPLAVDELEFLHELTEPLALALTRIHKLEQAETLKGQWQATFDSISHPLCLASADFEILKLNRAFQQACQNSTFRSLLGKNAFRVFFGKDFQQVPLNDGALSFRQSRQDEIFEVFGEILNSPSDEPLRRLLRFRPVTEEVRYERRIVQASKLAELGTIGSSIAHELNNPLGGMLSFLQLILMDLKPTDPIYQDLKSMEHATLRCRDIVVNLLSFARKQDLGDFTTIDLNEVVSRAVRLIELQSKSKGIEISIKGNGAFVNGSANALSQALCNLLQNSIDAISERIKSDSLFQGKIEIELDVNGGRPQLRVHDNGTGIATSVQSQIFNPLFTTRDPGQYSGMGLTTAFTIVSEHHGNLEILSQTGSGTTAILSLPALDSAGFNSRKTAF